MARVICPACKKAGNVPDEFLGQRIKCPNCGERFTAPKPLTLPGEKRPVKTFFEEHTSLPAIPARPAHSPPSAPIRLTRADIIVEPATAAPMPAVIPPTPLVVQPAPVPLPAKLPTKACPYCGEEILATALKCKHCSEYVDPALRAAEEAKTIARQAASHGHGQGGQQVVAVNTVIGDPAPRGRSGHWVTLKVGFVLLGVGFLTAFAEPSVGAALFGMGILVSIVGVVIGVVGSLFS